MAEIKKMYVGLQEAADYLNVSKSYLYKMTSKKDLPHYKPNGKKIFFAVSDLNSWIESGRVASNNEVSLMAVNHVIANSKPANKA